MFYDNLLKKYSVDNLIIKSMKLTPNMNVLYDFFPGGNYIMIVRDPRDIISSMLRVGKKQKDENIESHFPYNLSLLCNKINISYRLYLEPKFEDFVSKKIHTIKYEDFVTDPL
ncbi:MAG TPA: sulfotransferase, partial [Alphaproteobacteria bacterium]|nr:sulfotransferase [Alphaproteobacteria bacterium]